MMKKSILIGLVIICLAGISFVYIQFIKHQQPASQASVQITTSDASPTVSLTPAPPIQLESHQPFPAVRSKTTGCTAQDNLPDGQCTPGAINSVSKDQVCKSGYKATTSITEKVKSQVLAAYGISTRDAGKYVLDHLISPELGGSADVANIWPESTADKPGVHEKDLVESYLHKQVCAGSMTLDEAQHILATNWLTALQPTQE